MALDRKLLDVLCCPISKRALLPLTAEQLKRVNAGIDAGELRYLDNSPVDSHLEAGLITDNGQRVYRVDDGIPILLEDQAIPVDQIDMP